jgi:EmrB/QacA subfamily drug resistance transporter
VKLVIASRTARPANEKREAGPYVVLATVALGAMLAPLNSTMLAVALPAIRRDLDVGHGAVAWLVGSYLIAMAVTQPVGGRLGDQLGRVRVFQAGLLAFLGFSLAAALAPNFALLLTFRTLQAVAGAILIPNGMAMLRESVPTARFGRFSGLNGAAMGATAAFGPVLGGAILAFVSWRWLFVANVPVVALTLFMTLQLGRPRRVANAGARAVDVLGIVLFTAVLTLVTLVLSSLTDGQGGRTVLALAALAAVVVAFVWRQRTTDAPAAEWRLFRELPFLGASSHILLMNLAMYTTLLAIPFFLTDVQLRTTTVAGLLLASMAGVQALVSPLAGLTADRLGRRRPAIAGSLTALGGALMLVVGLSEDASLGYVAASITILGLGVGLGFVASAVAAVESAPRALAGSAAGTQSMMRYFGSIVGVGLLSGLLNTQAGDAPSIDVFRLLFAVVTAMLLLSLASAALIRPFPKDG